MSDLGALAGGCWFVAVGLAWTFAIFLPTYRRMRARPAPPEPPMKDQLRLVGGIVACSAIAVGIMVGLVLLNPFVGFAVAPLLFYGGLTILLRHLERAQSEGLGARRASKPALEDRRAAPRGDGPARARVDPPPR